MGVETTAISSLSFVNNPTTPTIPQQSRPSVTSLDELEPIDPKNVEAQKLISYHLDNYKRNSSYCLPGSLRPTLVQRTVPHESVIDRIPHPDLRDRLILLRGTFTYFSPFETTVIEMIFFSQAALISSTVCTTLHLQ
jgi:hypothetical protein